MPATPADLSLDLGRISPEPADDEAVVVQQRPHLGSLPRTRRGWAPWLLCSVDFTSASTVLAAVVYQSGSPALPALPLAPFLLIGLTSVVGLYAQPGRPVVTWGAGGRALPSVGRLLMTGLFAWSASLLVAFGGGTDDFGVAHQLALWLGAFALGSVGRMGAASLIGGAEQAERWVVVGDAETAQRLKAYKPLRAYARVVCTVAPPESDSGSDAESDRESALRIVDSNGADRVVIAAQNSDDRGLLALIKTFRSLGIPVSLLPRPLDLLEAPSAVPSRVGGVPLIEVGSLAAKGSARYRGPDRRRDRQPRVSVVIPALNEADNIGPVLERLPEGLHEVILVDGNSRDGTVKVATEVRRDIRVLAQAGRGKGDALRTGFAAVTGTLIVMLDADGSADPGEIPRFVEVLVGGADFAKGSRFLDGGGSADITPIRRLGNHFLSGTVNLLYGTQFTDLCYGYNAFWTRCLPFISLDAPGFEVETLINLRIASAGMEISEVPSYEAERSSGQSNLRTFPDGVRVFRTIVRESRLDPATRRRDVRHAREADSVVHQQDPAHSHTA
ncbi:MAG: glycosyltransferase family 2 protein [Actinomycetota bacterium]